MSDKPIYISKARRKAFDEGLQWELVETMDAKQLSIYLGEPVTDKAELHELFGDDYLKRSFELFSEKVLGKSIEKIPDSLQKDNFSKYKAAFLDGVTAHTNGNYY